MRCSVGDGSLQMNIQEPATIAELNLDIKIIVLDNHALNIVAQFQRQNWKSHPSTGGRYNPGKVFPTLSPCIEQGHLHVHGAQLPHPHLPRY